jgi:hypothetical protein
MAQMGRPEILTEARQSTLCTLMSVGVSQREAAEYVGCSPSTITKRAKRDAWFAARMRQAQMRSEYRAMKQMVKHGDRSWRASAWMLEKTRPERYGRRAGQGYSAKQVAAMFDQVTAAVLEKVADKKTSEEIRLSIEEVRERMFADQTPPPAFPASDDNVADDASGDHEVDESESAEGETAESREEEEDMDDEEREYTEAEAAIAYEGIDEPDLAEEEYLGEPQPPYNWHLDDNNPLMRPVTVRQMSAEETEELIRRKKERERGSEGEGEIERRGNGETERQREEDATNSTKPPDTPAGALNKSATGH